MGTFPHVLLGDVLLSIRAGVSVDGEARPLNDGEIGILTLSAVAAGRFDPTAFKAVTANGRRLGPSVSAGTLLMSRSNTEELVGTCAYVERDHPRLLLPDLLWEIRVRDDAPVVPRWLHAVLATEAMRKAIVRSASGTSGSMKKISMGRLRRIAVPAPDLARQRKAVAWLDQVAAALEQLQRLVGAKRRLKRALLQQLLTGKSRTKARVVALADVVRLRSGNTPSKARPDYWEGDFPWISAKDLKRSRIGDSIDKITALAVQESATVVPAGTVVILVRGMTLLKDVPVAVATRELAINQDIKGLEPSAEIDSGFLLCTLAAKRSQLMGFVNRAGHGTGKLDTDRLLSLPLRLPPIDEQRRIAASIDFLDHEANLLERQLAAYRQLKRGLMQRLLMGDINRSGEQLHGLAGRRE